MVEMKSISTILATILLVIIVVSIVGLFYTFSVTLFQQAAGGATNQTVTVVTGLGKQANIVVASCRILSNVRFTVRNVGNLDIKAGEMAAFIDGIKVNTVPDITTITLPAQTYSDEFIASFFGKSSARELKIVTPAGETSKIVNCNADPNLVGYWKFDEGSGTAITDSSLNGNTGTLGNGTVAQQPSFSSIGKLGGSLNFTPGTGTESIKVANIATVGDDISQRSAFTISFWINTTSSADQYIFSAANSTRANNILIAIMVFSPLPDHLYVWLENDIVMNLTNATFFNDGKWYLITLVKQDVATNSIIKLYINDTLYGTNTTNIKKPLIENNGVWLGNDQDFLGGGFSDFQQFRGLLDEFMIFNRSLSDTEIRELFSYF